MKIRNGFVSNSSSSSFCIVGYSIGDYEDEIAQFIKPEFKQQLEEDGAVEFMSKIKNISTETIDCECYYAGIDIYKMDDDETLSAFKTRVREFFVPYFTDDLPMPDIIVDGGYNG